MRLFVLFAVVFPFSVMAQDAAQVTREIVQSHVLPGFSRLADRASDLEQAAKADCSASAPGLRDTYGAAFDAWIGVSHLRFGPSEVEDRAFALAFWPDSRGATPRTLANLIEAQDPVAMAPELYREVSIAARGFYALEFLLYDDRISTAGNDTYRCVLVQTIAADIADVATAISADWETDFADRLMTPTSEGRYRSNEEAVQELFKSLSMGLQFTSDTRIARPLGTMERPRPKRAEAWRSGRSLHHVALSLAALRDIALRLAQADPLVRARLETAFTRSQLLVSKLDDPVFAGVTKLQPRFRIEALKNSVDAIRTIVLDDLGPTLGVAAGFNALDGD
ncbi:MAG: imelysin family protein [Roseovarius sp.]|nr:imelysin family protein [Roseovarius sp.]